MRDNEHLTPEKLKAYEFVLQGVQPDVLDRAMKTLAKHCTFFPTTGEIMEQCRQERARMIQEAETREILSRPGKPLLEGETVSVEEFQQRPDFKQAIVSFSMHRRRG